MSEAAVTPLQSYDPEWAARWEDANAAFERLKALAMARDPSDAGYERAVEAMELAVAEMENAYAAQFRTVEEYVAWRLQWLWKSQPCR
ncbi:hypothetical protein GCM10010909_12670 [Acidocella aquatica]|uniref:Uncharacterized protein n=1 Tax=Acidocella aquatica TaxID=1922313 RepID=A0ABQ6A4I5_9PROT|nr:hypothetical protein [Acidocella aquatica]GLR66587.1 hypothetical protein GCM10010909_12670 [Acidocella aquatica]